MKIKLFSSIHPCVEHRLIGMHPAPKSPTELTEQDPTMRPQRKKTLNRLTKTHGRFQTFLGISFHYSQ